MRDEVDQAARWWTTQLGKTISDEQVLDSFRRCLAEVMTEKYTGHWFEEDRLRGSGFRSISFDNRLDPCLIRAAKLAGIDSKELANKDAAKVDIENLEAKELLAKLLDHARGKIMFVNPGEVKIANAALLSAPARCIWDRTNGSMSKGVEWEEDTSQFFRQYDGVLSGEQFQQIGESPAGSPPLTPLPSPMAGASPTKAPLSGPPGIFQPVGFPSQSHASFKGLDESRASGGDTPTNASLGFPHSQTHNHNLSLNHSVVNAPRTPYPPHPSPHISPNPHVANHSHHSHPQHHSAHSTLGQR